MASIFIPLQYCNTEMVVSVASGENYECQPSAQLCPDTKASTNKNAVNDKNCQVHVHEEPVESRSFMGVPAKIERFERPDELEACANLNVQLCERY